MTYVTPDDYLGPWSDHADVTDVVMDNIAEFLPAVNDLLDRAYMDGVDLEVNPKTHSYIAGKTLGGFRPQDATQGAPTSSHKEGRGVDIYDPQNSLDQWCMRHQGDLEELGLFMEHPDSTPHWCHLTDRPPRSGRTVFLP